MFKDAFDNIKSLDSGLINWVETLETITSKRFSVDVNSDLENWLEILELLNHADQKEPVVKNGKLILGSMDTSFDEQKKIEDLLLNLAPWRKGPFDFHGVFVDTEWRSDFKWDRIVNNIRPLKDKTILDIGCGNGYHCIRMAEAGAKLALGIDPYIKNVVQFLAMKSAVCNSSAYVLPLSFDDLPLDVTPFDSIFSMGLLYHRKSPIEHLQNIRKLLKDGGELILETLVVEGDENTVLFPEDRYAMMRNVWFIPSPPALKRWVERVGFKNVTVVDITPTTFEEQRKTPFMQFDSLSEFLDPSDNSKTVEGYPAPVRAVIIAKK